MDNGLGAANRLVDLALLQGGLFLALADDRGGILVANRASLAILWRRQVHSGAISRVLTVGRGDDEAILSVDSYGTCVLSDPASGRTLHSWRPSLCVHPEPHGHQVEPAWDGEHVVLSCLQSWPPGIAPMIDAGASVGVVVNVHDAGSPALLCDRWGRELCHPASIKLPFAVGRSSRVAYLRAPNHWVGVRDLQTGHEIEICAHCYERGGYAVALSSDERWVAWSGYEKYGVNLDDREFVRLVCVDSAEDGGRNVLRGPADFVLLRFSPDSSLLVAGDAFGDVTVVPREDPASDRLLGRIEGALVGLAVTDDLVIALGATGDLCSWNVPV